MLCNCPRMAPRYPIPEGHANNGDDFHILMQGSAGHLAGYTLDVYDRTNPHDVDDMFTPDVDRDADDY